MKKALVLSLAMVLGLGVASFAQTLSGTWTTTVTIVPTPISLSIKSDLVVTYAVSGWKFTSTTSITDAGWQSQQFTVTGSLGAFTMGSTLDFTTTPSPAFKDWIVTGGLSIAGVKFDTTFTLKPAGTKLELVASGETNGLTFAADLVLGDGVGCDFDFTSIKLNVGFAFCCVTKVNSEIYFTCTNGFEYVKFDVTGIAIPQLPWVTLDASLKFETQTKTLTLTPVIKFANPACFTLYLTQDNTIAQGGGSGSVVGVLDAIKINGISFTCPFGDFVTFTGISYWGPTPKPGLLKGTDFWEAYQIKTSDKGCCGPFSFDITVYFLQGGLQLFDVAQVVANMSIQVATQFTFTSGITLDLTKPVAFTQWTLGFIVSWK